MGSFGIDPKTGKRKVQTPYDKAYRAAANEFTASRGKVAGYSQGTFRHKGNEFNRTLFNNLKNQYATAKASAATQATAPPPAAAPAPPEPTPSPTSTVLQQQQETARNIQQGTADVLTNLRQQLEGETQKLLSAQLEQFERERQQFGSQFQQYQAAYNPQTIQQQLDLQSRSLQERFTTDLGTRLGLQKQELTNVFQQQQAAQRREFEAQQQRAQEQFGGQLAGVRQEAQKQQSAFELELAQRAAEAAAREKDLTTELGTIKALTEEQELRLQQLGQEREKADLKLNQQLKEAGEATTVEQRRRGLSSSLLQSLLRLRGVSRPSQETPQTVNTLSQLLR